MADLRAIISGAPPTGLNSFVFTHVFAKNRSTRGQSSLPMRVGAPNGKSWIRPSKILKFAKISHENDSQLSVWWIIHPLSRFIILSSQKGEQSGTAVQKRAHIFSFYEKLRHSFAKFSGFEPTPARLFSEFILFHARSLFLFFRHGPCLCFGCCFSCGCYGMNALGNVVREYPKTIQDLMFYHSKYN